MPNLCQLPKSFNALVYFFHLNLPIFCLLVPICRRLDELFDFSRRCGLHSKILILHRWHLFSTTSLGSSSPFPFYAILLKQSLVNIWPMMQQFRAAICTKDRFAFAKFTDQKFVQIRFLTRHKCTCLEVRIVGCNYSEIGASHKFRACFTHDYQKCLS